MRVSVCLLWCLLPALVMGASPETTETTPLGVAEQLSRILKPENHPHNLCFIARVYLENGKPAKAIATADKVLASTLRLGNYTASAQALTCAAEVLVEAGQKKRAVELLSVAALPFDDYFAEGLDNSKCAQVAIGLAVGYHAIGDAARAERFVARALDSYGKIPPDHADQVPAAMDVLASLLKLGKKDRFFALAGAMEEDLRDLIYFDASYLLVAERQCSGLAELQDKVSNDGARAAVQSFEAVCLWRSGKKKAAKETIEKALELGRRWTPPKGVNKASLLVHLAFAPAEMGMKKEAMALLEEGRGLQDEGGPEGQRAFNENSIAAAYAGAGEYALAFDALERLGEPYFRHFIVTGLVRIGSAYLHRGEKPDKAAVARLRALLEAAPAETPADERKKPAPD